MPTPKLFFLCDNNLFFKAHSPEPSGPLSYTLVRLCSWPFSFQYLGMLITKIKVGKVTNLSEARYCAGMGVDFLSFPVSSIDPKTYKEITGWVAGPKFGIEAETKDISLIPEYKADFIEVTPDQIFHFTEGENLIIHLTPFEWPLKKSSLLQAKEKILYVDLSISTLDEHIEKIIREMTVDFEVFLKPSGSIDLEKILKLPIAGISLEGNAETKPGLKEYPLSEILEKLTDDTD